MLKKILTELMPELRTKTAAEIEADLAVVSTLVDKRAWTFAEIGRKLGSTSRATVNTTMHDIEVGTKSLPIGYEHLKADIVSARIAMSTGGMMLHEQESQDLIDVLASVGSWDAALSASVKGLGRPQLSLWVQLGGTAGAEPTEAEAQAVLDEIAFEEHVLRAVAAFKTNMTPSSDAGTVMSQAWTDTAGA